MSEQQQDTKVGGLSELKSANAQIQLLADVVRNEVAVKLPEHFVIFRAFTYKTQVVAGIMYYIKVQIDREGYVVIKVYEKLNNTGLELMGVQPNHTENDEITYFE